MDRQNEELILRSKVIYHAKLCQQVYIKLKRQIFQINLPDEVDKIVLQYVGLRPYHDPRMYKKRILNIPR